MSETLTGNRYFVSVVLFVVSFVCLVALNDFTSDSRAWHWFLYAGLFWTVSAFLSVLIIRVNLFSRGGGKYKEVLIKMGRSKKSV